MPSKSAVSRVLEIGGLRVDKAALQAHVMRPQNVVGVVSDPAFEPIAKSPKYNFTFAAGLLHELDVQGFGLTLQTALQNKVAGYVVRLQQGNNMILSEEWNWAQIPADGSEAWNGNVRMHVASCSKLITAMAMTRILNERQISFGTPIIGFLPTYWVKGPNINKITFRNLMTHTSGFDNGKDPTPCDFEFMKAKVAAGVQNIGTFNYQNMNFGLCRILLTTVLGEIAPGTEFGPAIIGASNDVAWDYLTIQFHAQYVQNYIFAPAGVSGATLDHPATDALAYDFPVTGKGWNSQELATMSGAVGWHMSAEEFLLVMKAFRRRGVIMSAAQAQEMLDNLFGIEEKVSTPIGPYYRRKGYWQGTGVKVEQSLVLFLPQDMELAVFVNSPIGPTPLEGVVFEALMSNLPFRDSALQRSSFIPPKLK
jgi:CubicO group peptidase (beta-lactamase class C family)